MKKATLKDWMPYDHSEYDLVQKHGDKKIIAEFSMYAIGEEKTRWIRFPQKHRAFSNVMNWCLLEDGSAVGWNESDRVGWSFPRIGKKTVKSVLREELFEKLMKGM